MIVRRSALLSCVFLLLACTGESSATVADAWRLFRDGQAREARAAALVLAEGGIEDAGERLDLAELLFLLAEQRRAMEVVSVEELGRVATERPGNARIRRLHGLWLLGSDGARALVELEAAHRLDDGDPLNWAYLGGFLGALGRTERARSMLTTACARFPGSPEVRACLAALLDAEGPDDVARMEPDDAARMKEVVRLLAPVAEERPFDRRSRLILSRALRATGRHAEAARVAQDLVNEWPDDASHWNALGLARGFAGEVREAVQALERASGLAPRDLRVLLNLGNAYLELAGVERDRAEAAGKAYRTFERAGQIAPGSDEVYVGLARAMVKSDPSSDPRAEEAIRLYRQALELNPRSFAAHMGLALLYYDLRIPDRNSKGEGYRRALEHFERAAELVPPSEWDPHAKQAYEELLGR